MINHLWQTTIFGAIVCLLNVPLRKNSAAVRFWLWCAASAKFLVPFSLFVAMGSHVPIATPAAGIPGRVSVIVEQIVEPAPAVIGRPAPSSQPSAVDWQTILAAAWLCGALTVGVRCGREWVRMSIIVKNAKPTTVESSVNALMTDVLLEPGVFGILRPVLLLPNGIKDRLSPMELKAVLAHERCHVQRRDNLWAAIHMATEALFWFHPLIWWIGNRMVEERERACDEEVLRIGSNPETYAEGILKVCELYLESPLPCLTGANLRRRIEGIMSRRIVQKLTGGRKLALAGAGALAVAVPFVVGVINAPILDAQTSPSATSKFEVASIKRCTLGAPVAKGSEGPSSGVPTSSPGRLNTGCETVADLISIAYVEFANGQPHPPQVNPIAGGPAWIKSDRYQIIAKADGSPPVNTMRGPMLQTLLEDRFALKIVREVKEGPVYSLTVAKGGPKFQRLKDGACTPTDLATPLESGQKPCGIPMTGLKGSTVNTEFLGSLAEFSKVLSAHVGRPVIDRTGIKGSFDLRLEFAIEESTNTGIAGPPSDPGAPSIFVGIQEQLGLRLESTKGPTDHFLINSVVRPSEN